MENTTIDNETLKRTIRRLSYEIIEKNNDLNEICLIGIKRKGITLAKIIQENIKSIEGININTGSIDITPYRDDVKSNINKNVNKETVPFIVKNKVVIKIITSFLLNKKDKAELVGLGFISGGAILSHYSLVCGCLRKFPDYL